MRMLLAVLTGLLATPFASPALAQLHPTGRTVITQAVEGAIRPGFDAFAAQTKALQGAMTSFCASPSEAALVSPREQFGNVVRAWSRIEIYRFGPLMKDNRSDRILFWPDRKGVALRQVQAILAGGDATATDPDALKEKSVAVQGLGALEFVLFGTGAEALQSAEGQFRCAYGTAITVLMAEMAQQMSAEWADPSGISGRMIRPQPDDPDYRSNEEVLQELIGTMVFGVEASRDQRILPFLGRDGQAPKPRSALFWRSNLTMDSVLGNFDGVEALLVKSDIWRYVPPEQFVIGEGAQAEFARIRTDVGKATGTVEQAMANAAQKQAIADIVASTQVLGKLLGEDLPSALGLSVGFSSLDGD